MSTIEAAPPALETRSSSGSPAREVLLCRLLGGAAALAFVAYFGLFCFVQKWGSDFEVYVAAVSRLYQHLLRPTHEALMASGDQTFAYSPYLLVVAALGK